ncbi:hypothetical protein ABZS98_39450 [Streptomyces avermitilis]|uniref:hypothetical protein n=1 Tax=Streptomyces avermitilis TaxID=33903 RepID=UPI00339FF69A
MPADTGNESPPDSADPPAPADAAPDDDIPTAPDGQATDPSVQQNVRWNRGTVIGVQNVHDIRRLRGTPLPDEWIASRLAPYLPDADLTTAITRTLENHRVAVIHAPVGTGRYTTALHVLTHHPVKAIRQVRREPGEAVDLEGLTDEDTGWILDLRDEEETLRTGFGLHLIEAEEHLRSQRSFVVVVTHTSAWSRLSGEATDLAYLLTPPQGLEVLRAHLTRPQPGIEKTDPWLADTRIKQAMAKATPAHAAHWARIIRTAVVFNSESTEEPKPVAELVDTVVQSAQNWRRTLRQWHIKNTDSAHRNYLLAAAALDGAPAETVYDAHNSLGTALDDTPRPPRGQQGPGIIELTHNTGAELGADDRIRFLQPGYAEAVVDYFWVDRPHHAAAFTKWTAEQATSLPPDLGSPLADRVTQWATRYTLSKQSFTILRAVTAHWAGSHLDGHAQDLLVAAAVDPTAGKRAREQYLAWAKYPDTEDLTTPKHTPIVLKQALAGALAQLGPVYPQIVLKRLSELAAHTDEDSVTAAVGDALTTLWDQQNLRGKIRTTLTSWFRSSQSHYTDAASRAFLHLADRTGIDDIPLFLAPDGEPATEDWTLEGWRCALDGKRDPLLQRAFNTWLDAALSYPDLQPAVLNTFTEAVFRSDTDRTYLASRYLVLNHAANGWEPAHAGQQPTQRTRLRDELVIAIREADPTSSAHSHRAAITT